MNRFTRIFSLVFAIGVFVLYARCVCFAHIGLDDAAYTFRNPFVAGGLSFGNVVEAFTNLQHGGIWMPVTYVSYMLDASICRLTGVPLIGEMHFVNVLLHIVNFLLLWKLLRILSPLTAERPTPSSQFPTCIAVFAAMIWAVHPLRVEPVAWIAARKELLWSLFTLSGLICWIKNYQLSTIIFCALACLSKPTAMCFPFLALLVAWWIRRGLATDTRHSTRDSQQPMAFNLRIARHSVLIATVLLAAATAAIATYSQTHVAGREASVLYAAPLSHRLVNALSAIGFYLKATILPFGLHLDCRSVVGLWPLDAGRNFATLWIVLVMLVFWILFLAQRRRGAEFEAHPSQSLNPSTPQPLNPSTLIIFTVSWFLIPLIPTLGIFGSFGMEAHADRFTYFPSMAFAFLIVMLAKWTVSRRPTLDSPLTTIHYPLSTIICHLSVIIFLSAVTFLQLSYWRDDATAHLRALACDPEHPRALVHVADARCSRQRDFDGGIRLYRQALFRADTVPKGGFDVEDVKAKLAYALATRGRKEDFVEVKRLGAAVVNDARRDRRGLMLDALGTAFFHDGDLERAASLFKASLAAPDRFWPKASTQRKLEQIFGR